MPASKREIGSDRRIGIARGSFMTMRAGAAGAATLRHVGFVALEALLIAILVWFAAMTLAGAGPTGGGLVGTAQAGRDPATLTVGEATFGKPVVVSVRPTPAIAWIHVACSRESVVVLSEWVRTGATGKASVKLGPRPGWTGGDATCVAEAGIFTTAGRWRAQASTTFEVVG
jgi:hypothetical protein